MKIICDCGEELLFVEEPREEDDSEEDGTFCTKKGGIDVSAEHDQVWLKCHKCSKAIWIFC